MNYISAYYDCQYQTTYGIIYMSSIYKKGRDGYYYYQAYVFNEKTGKKDKRIFYSLGTKNIENAQAKKNVLDEELNKKNKKSNWKSKSFIFLFIFSFCTFIYKSINNDETQTFQNVEHKKLVHNASQLVKKDSFLISPVPTKEHKKSYMNQKNIAIKKDLEFKIIRSEKIKGGFNQIKLFITVPRDTESDLIRLVCEKVKNNHSEYKSFTICVYSNTKSGLELADGGSFNKNTYLHKKAWLAMYSFNPIEGEYFDDNPSHYSGVLN